MKILNLTCHTATFGQIAAGVVEFTSPERFERLLSLLKFNTAPSELLVKSRTMAIVALAMEEIDFQHKGKEVEYDEWGVMLGGALWLMKPLTNEFGRSRVVPMFAFSERKSVETMLPNGQVEKTQVFKHAGWVKA